jgi:hypothetical protein
MVKLFVGRGGVRERNGVVHASKLEEVTVKKEVVHGEADDESLNVLKVLLDCSGEVEEDGEGEE